MKDVKNKVGTAGERGRAMQILAKSLYRDLLEGGYGASDAIALATALIGEVTSHSDDVKTSAQSLPV